MLRCFGSAFVFETRRKAGRSSARSPYARSRRRDEPTPEPNQAEVPIIGEPPSRDLVAGLGVGKHPVRPSRKMEFSGAITAKPRADESVDLVVTAARSCFPPPIGGCLVATRDFDPAYSRSGSIAPEVGEAARPRPAKPHAHACPLRPASGQTGRCLAKSASCHKRTYAVQQIALYHE